MKKSVVMFCLLLSITDNALGNITIENSWVRAAAPGTKVMAAYMTIENNSVKPIEMDIKKIISKGFKKTEVHKSSRRVDKSPRKVTKVHEIHYKIAKVHKGSLKVHESSQRFPKGS